MTAQEVTLTASMPRAVVLPNRTTCLISRSNPEDANNIYEGVDATSSTSKGRSKPPAAFQQLFSVFSKHINVLKKIRYYELKGARNDKSSGKGAREAAVAKLFPFKYCFDRDCRNLFVTP